MEIYVNLFRETVQYLTDIDGVLDYLLSFGHITTGDYEIITSQNAEKYKIRKMLEILQKSECSPKTFVGILSITGNEQLVKLFQKEMGMKVVQEKPIQRKENKRKIFILEGMKENKKLRACFSNNNPNWEVTFALGSLNKLMEEIASIQDNKYKYFDIIVCCNEAFNDITDESLKTILARIEELLPKFPTGIITFLIIVNENDDYGRVIHSNRKPQGIGDAQSPESVIRILKKKFLDEFMDAFLRSENMFNSFINKKLQLETRLKDQKPVEETIEKRKIFILKGTDENEKLYACFQENSDWEVTFTLGSLNKLMEEISSIPENKFTYFDIIVVCDEEYDDITNESLKEILPRIDKEVLPKFPPSIITFLIIVNENDDNGRVIHSNTKPQGIGDAQSPKSVIRILKKKFLKEFMDAFFKSVKRFNIFINEKLQSETHLEGQKLVEETIDKRKIFILQGMDENKKLLTCFSENNPNWEMTFALGSLNKLMEEIAPIQDNKYKYFDIIVSCNEAIDDITDESLKTILARIEELLPKFPLGIITFLIIVDTNDDNAYVFPSNTKPECFGDKFRGPVIRILNKNFLDEFTEAFFNSQEMFDIFINKKIESEKTIKRSKPWE